MQIPCGICVCISSCLSFLLRFLAVPFFVLTGVAMTYLVKLDAIIRDASFPRTAISTLDAAAVLLHTNAKLLFLRMSNACFAQVAAVSQAD